jgi:hypothetical protein
VGTILPRVEKGQTPVAPIDFDATTPGCADNQRFSGHWSPGTQTPVPPPVPQIQVASTEKNSLRTSIAEQPEDHSEDTATNADMNKEGETRSELTATTSHALTVQAAMHMQK